MAYECKTLSISLEGSAPVCTEWQEASFLPELTGADRDVILQWAIGLFALVFVAKKILRLL